MNARRGFTLIEVMVAIAILALIAVVSWRGIDGISRAQSQTRQVTDSVQTMQTAMAQWGTDLDNVVTLPQVNPIDWDGRVLRITRRSTQPDAIGPLVVAWTMRSDGGAGQWLRWQSPPLTSRAALNEAWQRAAQWAQNPGDAEKKFEVAVMPLTQWQIFYFRNDAWSNPLSSPGAATPAAGTNPTVDPNLIQGVRLVLTLPHGQPVTGTITRDWVRPTVGGGKS